MSLNNGINNLWAVWAEAMTSVNLEMARLEREERARLEASAAYLGSGYLYKRALVADMIRRREIGSGSYFHGIVAARWPELGLLIGPDREYEI